MSHFWTMKPFLAILILFSMHISHADDNLSLNWNTFTGSSDKERISQSIVDKNGNIYFTGRGMANWGTPIRSHSLDGGEDMVIAKFNRSGEYQWHTFFGAVGQGSTGFRYIPDGYDEGLDIALDSQDNIFIIGYSKSPWGNPLSGSQNSGIVLIKLNPHGEYQWHRFTHQPADEFAFRGKVFVDRFDNLLVFGAASTSWGTPIHAHHGGQELVIAKYDNNGNPIWHTFLGGTSSDEVGGIKTDRNGNIFISGISRRPWNSTSCGTPLNPHVNHDESEYVSNIFVSQLNQHGQCQWHTYLGGTVDTQAMVVTNIALDISGNIYTTGYSFENWGTPLNGHVGFDYNTTLVKFSPAGEYQWHTFKKGKWSKPLVTDISGNIYLTDNAGMAKYRNSGSLEWESSPEVFDTIGLDKNGGIILAGETKSTWGTPLNHFNGEDDFSIAYYSQVNCGQSCAASRLFSSAPSQQVSSASIRAIDTVQKAYLAYYGRPGDPAGIDYWAQILDETGGSWTSEIINAFGNSEEFQSRFGHLSPSELIRNIYLQLFNREPDIGGLNYFSELLDSEQASLGEIAVIILEGATGDDKVLINHKLTTADYFTEKVAETDSYGSIDRAISMIENVSTLPASLVYTFSIIDAF